MAALVILGGGVIGASTTFSLVNHPKVSANDTVTLVEGTEIAAGASGKSGGFLALDWHGPATSSLAALSFKLHEDYATQHGGAKLWGYRKLDTLSVSADTRSRSSSKRKLPPGLEWLDVGAVKATKVLGTKQTTAQVHPRLLTTKLVELAQEKGAKVVMGRAGSIEQGEAGPTAVVVTDRNGHSQSIPCTDVVITAGPWSGELAHQLLGEGLKKRIRIEGTRAHSIVVKTEKPLSEHALFCDLAYEGGHGDPEIYCRPDGTAYICYGGSDDESLPATAADVMVDSEKIATIKAQSKAMSPEHLGTGVVEAEQACYLPTSSRGTPLVGQIAKGVFIGSAHSCWGITLGPGTGHCLAEMLLEGKVTSADIDALAP